MDVLLAIVIVSLATGGLGLGLMLGRGPPRTSCGAAEDLGPGRCADCPLRRAAARKEATCRNTA